MSTKCTFFYFAFVGCWSCPPLGAPMLDAVLELFTVIWQCTSSCYHDIWSIYLHPNIDRSEFWMRKMKAEMVFYKNTVLHSYVVMCCSLSQQIELFCCSFCDKGGISCEVTQVNLSARWNRIRPCQKPCHCHFLVWIETAKMDHCHMYFSASWCELFSVTYCILTAHVFLWWNVTRSLYQNTFFLQTMEEPNFVPSCVSDGTLLTDQSCILAHFWE